MPEVHLPKHLEGYAEDAGAQIRRAVDFHEQVFGRSRAACGPRKVRFAQRSFPRSPPPASNGSPRTKKFFPARPNGWISRDSQGFCAIPEMLYRPWRVEEKGQSLQIVFRDHAMSDQIGFHYQRHFGRSMPPMISSASWKPSAAPLAGNAGQRPTLVSIILDGENCWEYYPNGGVDFLRTLYRRIAEHPRDHAHAHLRLLEHYPATDKIGTLFAGSWIQHNFGIWIGHPECNRAWDLVFESREHCGRAEGPAERRRAIGPGAARELLIAEGSDWFWWFGDSHSQRPARTCLIGCFASICKTFTRFSAILRRTSCSHPIRQRSQPRMYTEPTGLLNVKVDGRRTYFEWINAGHYACTGSRRGDEHGAGRPPVGLVFRVRHRAAAAPFRCSRRHRPRTIERH